MKLILVNPAYTFWREETQPLSSLLGCSPPLGLLSLGAYVRENIPNIKVYILDAPALGISNVQLAKRIIAMQPDVVGITVTTMVMPAAGDIARQIKSTLPDTFVLVGGPHISSTGVDSLREVSEFDFGVVGEGERTLVELLLRLSRQQNMHDLPGLIFRNKQGQPCCHPQHPQPVDLDVLPLPAWDMLDGFPQKKYRYMTVPAILQAVETLQEKYEIRYLVFCDDTFTLHRNRTLELCNGLSQLKNPLTWSCDANVVTIDQSLLKAMKRAGCWSISFGLESGSPVVLNSLNKPGNVEQALQTIKDTRQAGIHAKGLFIMGTPEESAESIHQTREFIQKAPLSTLNLSKFTPYCGSPLHGQIADQLTLGWEHMNGMNFVVASKHMTIEQLELEYQQTLAMFYRTFRSWRGHLPIMLGQWNNIRRLIAIIPYALKTIFYKQTEPRETE